MGFCGLVAESALSAPAPFKRTSSRSETSSDLLPQDRAVNTPKSHRLFTMIPNHRLSETSHCLPLLCFVGHAVEHTFAIIV